MNILDQIVIEKKNLNKYLKQKKFYIKKNSKKKSLFRNSILQEIKKDKNGLIAEFKRFSPSVKNFSKIKSIQNTIEIYDKSKCCCISILTDKNFGGSLNDITIAKKLTKKPIIRKDFILDKIQVLESKLYGADAILLIAKILTKKQIEDLYEYANELKLDVLIEIESIHEISKIKNIKNSISGINNRNLKEQIINIDKLIYLSHLIKNENLIVSESGINIKNKNKTIEMVDISKKKRTTRIAIAESLIKIDKNLFKILLNDKNLFSNLCATAKIAGIFAAKNTSLQIPLTHHIPIDHISIEFTLLNNEFLKIKSSVKSKYTTGLEIEALTSVSTSSITIFDMLKSYKKEIIIQNIQIVKKRGGKNNIG